MTESTSLVFCLLALHVVLRGGGVGHANFFSSVYVGDRRALALLNESELTVTTSDFLSCSFSLLLLFVFLLVPFILAPTDKLLYERRIYKSLLYSIALLSNTMHYRRRSNCRSSNDDHFARGLVEQETEHSSSNNHTQAKAVTHDPSRPRRHCCRRQTTIAIAIASLASLLLMNNLLGCCCLLLLHLPTASGFLQSRTTTTTARGRGGLAEEGIRREILQPTFSSTDLSLIHISEPTRPY